MMSRKVVSSFFTVLLASGIFTSVAVSQPVVSAQIEQQGDRSGDSATEGVAVSSSRNTLVVRTDDNQYKLFVYSDSATRPKVIPGGSRVRVESITGDQPGVRTATVVTVTQAASGQTAGPASPSAPVPEPVQNLETEIQRAAKRWRVGVRAGAALDPELFLFGVHSQIGPIFRRDISFRPSAEFAFGELTDMIALNLEATYRLPFTPRTGRWSPYIGAGPALNFIHQGFSASGGRDISFGNFDYETGFNILTGLQFRKGTFFEMKTSLWSKPAPVLRLIVGYNF
jgi:hypothetical protein